MFYHARFGVAISRCLFVTESLSLASLGNDKRQGETFLAEFSFNSNVSDSLS